MTTPWKDTHKRWRVWPFASGAYSSIGGHCKLLGVQVMWLPKYGAQPKAWHPAYEVSVFHLIAFKWNPDAGFRWAFCSLSLKFKRATWRVK